MSAAPGDDVRFADGFDTPDRVAFGLGAAQLLVVACGVLAGYALLRSPLPILLSAPLALSVASAAGAAGWLRLAGRPALDWVVFAVRFITRPRRGTLLVAASHAPAEPMAAPRPFVLRDEPAPAQSPPPLRRPRVRRGGAHRITFFSLKGGTGRTTLATELAAQLAAQPARQRRQVALLDLDLRAASVGARLGLQGATLMEFATAPPDERRARDHLTAHPSRLQVLLGPERPPRAEWPVTAAVLRELLRELDMEGFDVVVIDLAPELSPVTEAALRSVDDVFIVLAPTASGVHDAYRTTEVLRRHGLRHQLRYVVNRTRAGVDLSETMRDLDGRIVAEIPDDVAVTDSENAHRLAASGRGPAAHALQRFARRVNSELSWSCED